MPTVPISATRVMRALKQSADPIKAEFFPSFFKTGKGQYGEGDVFIGVTVPAQRGVAKRFVDLPLPQIKKLLASKIHEHRLTALLILDYKVLRCIQSEDPTGHKEIVDFYLANRIGVNNWDLVDASASQILGAWLVTQPAATSRFLYDFAKSQILWERRIAVVATYAFIRHSQFEHTLRLSEMLLGDKHDLMHKACGWMLREVGKRDEKVLRAFLDKHVHNMPRTMLRYAIEKFDEKTRKRYLEKDRKDT